MGRSADEVSPSVVAEGRTVRRRLIQSTLFPHKSPPKEIEEVPDGDCSQFDTVEGEGQIKIKRKRGRPPKVSSPNKITFNGEGLSKTMENRSSPASDHGDFLDKNSNRQLTRQHQKKQQSDSSPQACSPSKPVGSMRSRPLKSKKQQVRTTPSKSIRMNNLKEPCSKETPIYSVQTLPALQSIPDLRFEAKMTAEENSRFFAGKKIHPFFSSRKPSKKFEGIPESQMYLQCSVDVKNDDFILGPIHVVDTIQEDVVSPDWKNWVFFKTPFPSRECDQDGRRPLFIQGSQKSLNIGNLRSQHQSSPSFLNGIALDVKEVYSCAGIRIPSIDEGKKDNRIDEVVFSSGLAVRIKNTVQVDHGKCHEDRQVSYDSPRHSIPNTLWTKKYHPESAAEVCGNSESVKILSEWLHLWHERAYQSTKESNGDRGNKQDFDPSYYDSDSDSDLECRDEGSKLKNVLLITGPVGSGKSAAIYACALEQGFRVIEVNTSDWRNGALVKQKFGEAVESHRLKWSRESHQSPQSKPIKNDFPAISCNKSTEESDQVVEIIPLLDSVNDNQEGTGMTTDFGMGKRKGASGQGEIKSLVHFEDVDITFYEDKGFIAAIQQLAETAKLPMILTANSNYPVLPESLARLELFFVMPSPEQLYNQVCKVCAGEKANVNPHLIEQYIRCFHRDIRKTIMHLQFWYQDEGSKKDKEIQRVCGPLLFDIEAGHFLLEKMIPWDFPSQLAQLIEIEISKSLLLIEDHSVTYNVIKEDNVDKCNDLGMHKNETDSWKAKKDVMLSRNLSAQNDTPCKSSDLSGSPVAFTRRNVRRKLDRLLSFSSEDELPEDSVQEATHKISFDIDLNYPPPSPKNENCFTQLTSQYIRSDTRALSPERKNCLHPFPDHTNHIEKGNLLNNDFPCSDIGTNSHNYWLSRLEDVSCVPESSFVPESVMNEATELSEAVSYFNVPIVEEVSMGSDNLLNSSPVAAANVNLMCQLPQDSGIVGIGHDVNGESVITEEVSGLHELQAATREFPIMDECSRIDFSKSRTLGKPISRLVTESIQETWKRIRLLDLGEYVASEENEFFRVVELAYGICNFISEADLLLLGLDMQQKDSWKMNLYEDSDASHWYNTQLQMTSAVSLHCFFLYAKGLASAGSKVGFSSNLELTQEIVCTDDTSTSSKGSQDIESKGIIPSKRRREMNSSLLDTVQSLVPLKSYFTVRGDSFHEYLSSLNHIRRSEDSRLTLIQNSTNRRRSRVARHYLSMLSPEDVSLLEKYNCYGKFSFQSAEASLR